MKTLIAIISIILLIGCNSNAPNQKKMKLWTLSNYGQIEKIISVDATESEIRAAMESLNWNEFHQVILEKSNGDLMEVGGSLTEDGLSVLYQENEKQHVITTPPKKVDEMTRFLLMYLEEDHDYKSKYKFE